MSRRQPTRGSARAFRHSHAAVGTGAHAAVRVLAGAGVRFHYPAVALPLQRIGKFHGRHTIGGFGREYHGRIHFVLPKHHGLDTFMEATFRP